MAFNRICVQKYYISLPVRTNKMEKGQQTLVAPELQPRNTHRLCCVTLTGSISILSENTTACLLTTAVEFVLGLKLVV